MRFWRFFTVLLICSVFIGCSRKQESAGSGDARANTQSVYKIGYTITDLTNPVWSASLTEVQKRCAALGWQMTLIDCKNEGSTQLSQIENFITSGCNIICIIPVDGFALEEVIAKAHEKGILIFADSLEIPQADTSWMQNNEEAGEKLAESAVNWIRSRYGNQEVEIAILDAPFIPVCMLRVDGMKDYLAKNAPNIKLVAQGSAITVPDGMTQAESMLQAHPNIKAFLGVNDGGILGACEVLESRGANPDDYGCFGMDAVEEALTKIKGNTPYKMTINFGTASDQVNDKLKCIKALHDGNYEKVYYAPTNVIDKSNINNS